MDWTIYRYPVEPASSKFSPQSQLLYTRTLSSASPKTTIQHGARMPVTIRFETMLATNDLRPRSELRDPEVV